MRLTSFLFFCLVLAACAGSPTEARQDYEQAVALLKGIGVQQDTEQGMDLLVRAADGGNADAQLALGFYVMKGTGGMEQDSARAFAFFEQAAEAGKRDAQYNVGLAYVRAEGVAKDYAKAVSWFEKAAYQGDAGAMYNLGVMHLNGEGTVKDPVTAYAWFTLAAERGFDGADDGKASARADMTPEQAEEIERTIRKTRAKIKEPAAGSIQPL